MYVSYGGYDNRGKREQLSTSAGTPAPIIYCSCDEIESRSGMSGGPVLVQIVVKAADGRRAIANVSATVNYRGQVKFELSTNKGGSTVRSNVTARWVG